MSKEAMRGVPDAIHRTDISETLEYITGWNDCRAAMLEQHQGAEHMSKILIDEATVKMALEYLRQRKLAWNVQIALREALAEQPAQQEPVAWISEIRCIGPEYGKKRYSNLPIQSSQPGYYAHTPLYTTPQAQRKPLTVAEVEQILAQHNYEIHGDRARYIVRMTEVAHNIKEKNT